MNAASRLLAMSSVAVLLGALAAPPHTADYVAHEWGTFTSVQGADGLQLDWNPLRVTDLPNFVYDRSRLRGQRPVVGAKAGLTARQRLETPVIYFYSDKARTVDVRVDFPEGSVTEWYPQQDPPATSLVRPGEPAARWKRTHILTRAATEPAYPREATGSHYYAARETDANPVRIETGAATSETEKFLFYRGTGRFYAPLVVSSEGDDAETLRLANTGREPLAELFVYRVSGATAQIDAAPAIAAGGRVTFTPASKPMPLTAARIELAARMQRALVASGLYEREAAAMVKTWDDAWFAEQGLRVLYLLPRAWTDRTLPLTLDPAPREVARVMVGRAELLTPRMEKALSTEVERYRSGDETARSLAVENARVLGLGRFAEPAVRRLCLADPTNTPFSNAAWELLWKSSAPAPATPTVAGR